MALKLDFVPGEALEIEGGRIKITIEEKSGRGTRLRIEADRSIPVEKVTPYNVTIQRKGLKKLS